MESRVNVDVVEKPDTLSCVEQNDCQVGFGDTYPELERLPDDWQTRAIALT